MLRSANVRPATFHRAIPGYRAAAADEALGTEKTDTLGLELRWNLVLVVTVGRQPCPPNAG